MIYIEISSEVDVMKEIEMESVKETEVESVKEEHDLEPVPDEVRCRPPPNTRMSSALMRSVVGVGPGPSVALASKDAYKGSGQALATTDEASTIAASI